MSIKSERTKWLKANGITLSQFSERIQVQFGTVYKWQTTGRTPRKLYLNAVLAVYPDWPHKA
jgi:transposase